MARLSDHEQRELDIASGQELDGHLGWVGDPPGWDGAPIPDSALSDDGFPIVKCHCGLAWCIDRSGERAYRAYAKHWRENHAA